MEELLMSEPSVIAKLLPASGGKFIGTLTLNSITTLNSLDGEMVKILTDNLGLWEYDDNIACVLIKASGEKAFCAGGDVQALRKSSFENPGGPCIYAEDFFEREYRMNYLLHSYSKPVVCWGHGIVMGGGLGILAACSHRVVTASTRIAMPEVTIALFPDVGASWFLNKMPSYSGLFLALTAASMNGADALYTGLADLFTGHENQDEVILALQSGDWSDDLDSNHRETDSILGSFDCRSQNLMPEGRVEVHRDVIERICKDDSGGKIIDNIITLKTDDKWLRGACEGLAGGSPLAALWIHKQLVSSVNYSLKKVFQSELQLATNIMRYPEFSEGVRALLIDKDKDPKWQYPDWRSVPANILEQFFEAPWEQNPLVDL
tara:strand:- start:569 stop:1699 length:1131 start_codon:yes stop_codon:yes gene_type:complete